MNYNKTASLSQYIKEKLRMLKEDFCVKLTYAEVTHLKSLKTEIQVDQYAHDLLVKKL